MKQNSVRLIRMELEDFKNIEHGIITIQSCKDTDCFSHAGILGIYGQNGSGKTAVVNSLALLHTILSGGRLQKNEVFCIRNGVRDAKCTFSFIVKQSSSYMYKTDYSFTLTRKADDDKMEDFYLSAEKLTFKNLETNEPMVTLLEYSESEKNTLFSPLAQLHEFVTTKNRDDFMYEKRAAQENRGSFFFSRQFSKLIQNSESVKPVADVLSTLFSYAMVDLFVISEAHSGMITLNACIPFSFRYEQSGKKSIGELAVNLNNTTVLPLNIYKMVKSIITDMNTVINALVPGLSIHIKEYGPESLPNTQTAMRFELFSNRNGTAIPLRYESEGIKKILSILNLLIGMYNHENICVVVDELDAGIFEYLLGELLTVLKENAKGQLIFTSHNLRPLEVLDSDSVVFTTTAPADKYIHFKKVKNCNNLRDMFIRAINLGGQDEELYAQTDKSEIRKAFRQIGEKECPENQAEKQ